MYVALQTNLMCFPFECCLFIMASKWGKLRNYSKERFTTSGRKHLVEINLFNDKCPRYYYVF